MSSGPWSFLELLFHGVVDVFATQLDGGHRAAVGIPGLGFDGDHFSENQILECLLGCGASLLSPFRGVHIFKADRDFPPGSFNGVPIDDPGYRFSLLLFLPHITIPQVYVTLQLLIRSLIAALTTGHAMAHVSTSGTIPDSRCFLG